VHACRHPAPPWAIAGDSSHDHSFQVPLLSLFSVPSSLLFSSACRTWIHVLQQWKYN
jgi:hypothetical protein